MHSSVQVRKSKQWERAGRKPFDCCRRGCELQCIHQWMREGQAMRGSPWIAAGRGAHLFKARTGGGRDLYYSPVRALGGLPGNCLLGAFPRAILPEICNYRTITLSDIGWGSIGSCTECTCNQGEQPERALEPFEAMKQQRHGAQRNHLQRLDH